jgi:bifunctional DNase/RNase
MPEGHAGILVLREKGKGRILPVVVPDGRDLRPGAPATDGLLGRAIAALGARVAEVEIEEAEESAAGARVRMTQGGKQVELPAVTSESVALALAANAPIYARRRLLEDSGLTPEDLARAHRAVQDPGATRL